MLDIFSTFSEFVHMQMQIYRELNERYVLLGAMHAYVQCALQNNSVFLPKIYFTNQN